MKFIPAAINQVVIIEPVVINDERGFFSETYKRSIFQANGIIDDFVQDNHSSSTFGVLRGLHYQLNPKAQAKLVRCIRGTIFDVAVDIRENSPTFGRWVGCELSQINKRLFYIPAGFAHGFLTISNEAEVLYKSANEYSPQHERGIIYNDPNLGIAWPTIGTAYTLSAKDQQYPPLHLAEMNFNEA